MKVMTRLQNVTYLQTLLETALAGELLPDVSVVVMQCGAKSGKD